MIRKKVGSITLAVGLIAMGVLLLSQNFMNMPIKDIYKYWPILLVGFGIEMVIYTGLYRKNNTEVRLSVDSLCIIFIIVLGLLSGSSRFINIDTHGFTFFGHNGSSVIDGIRYKSEISEEYNKYNISEGFDIKELKVSNSFGEIEIRPTDAKSISIDAEVTVKCNNEEKARKYAKDSIKIVEGEITELSPRNPLNWNKDDYAKARIDFIIYVPAGVNVEAKGSFGDINAEGVGGKCTLEGRYGNIKALDINGDTKIINSFGNVDVRNVEGKADISCMNGEISADSISGSAVIEGRFGEIEAEAIGGDLEITNRNGETEVKGTKGNVQISNSFGDIYLSSAALDNGDIYAKTKFGSINCEKPLELIKEGQNTIAKGRLGTGEYNIELTTNNGDITIE